MFRRILSFILILFIFQNCVLSRFARSLNTKKNSILPTSFNNFENTILLKQAQQWMNVPYKNGGVDNNGMDCSGLLFKIYSDTKFSIPRAVIEQESFGLYIPQNKINIGDWLFFKTNYSPIINHVGIVKKIDMDHVVFIHASTSTGVREDDLSSKYWIQCFVKAVRPFKQLKK